MDCGRCSFTLSLQMNIPVICKDFSYFDPLLQLFFCCEMDSFSDWNYQSLCGSWVFLIFYIPGRVYYFKKCIYSSAFLCFKITFPVFLCILGGWSILKIVELKIADHGTLEGKKPGFFPQERLQLHCYYNNRSLFFKEVKSSQTRMEYFIFALFFAYFREGCYLENHLL